MQLVTQLLGAVSLFGAAFAIDNADITGLSFVDTTSNQRLEIIGVDYQPGGSAGFDAKSGADVLGNGTVCLRDAVVMQQLGINTIRVYNVNPQTNHDDCMSIFNAAGIYVIIDVNTPSESIDRTAPATSYTADYLAFIFSQVENFKGYPNLLAFFAGNEIINDVPSAMVNPPYIRAVVRDLREYIAKQSTRHIPVGYSAADVRTVLEDTWNYLRCDLGTGDYSAIEMFGLNSYSWCGAATTWADSDYSQIVKIFTGTNIPVFYSEYGCNQPTTQARVFNEVQALYGVNMTVLNGGLVYEWSQEASDYGLVTINDDQSITLRQDFLNLQAQYNKLDKALITKIPTPNTNTVPACDATLLTSDSLPTNWTIPPTPAAAAAYITGGVPKAINGKIVPVTNTVPSVKIFDVNNNVISGLQLETLSSGSNSPSGANTTSGKPPTSGVSSTGASGSASPNNGNLSAKGAASGTVQITSGLALAAVALTMIIGF